MRDLWNELARRVRAADQSANPMEQAIPFGFCDAVLRKAQKAARDGSNLFEDWISVLRPALGLALGTAVLCLFLQYRIEQEAPADAVAQTEALIQLAVLDD
jgi:hypothetical protein